MLTVESVSRWRGEVIEVTDELMTMQEAAESLGVSRFKMGRLVRDGLIQAYVSPLDRRQKLVRRRDVDALRSAVEPIDPEQTTGKGLALAA